jgi:hypothetical protein
LFHDLTRCLARLALGLALVLGVGGAAFAQNLEIIDLQHRPADQVLPSVQAIVGTRGAVTGAGFKLFVRADAATLAQVRRMVAELDVAPRRLMISVRQIDAGASSRVQIQTGARVSPNGTVVTVAGSAQADRSDAAIEQRIQTLDGARALIHVGETRMTPTVVVNGNANGGQNVGVVATPVEAATSVYVVARVNGDTVLLDIEPEHASFGPQGEIRSQGLSTQAAGRLGEWIDLGASDRMASSAGADMQARMHVQVRVELLP